ncbi:MAG TPA: YfiR family protein [Opitutaceae bacterium]
MRRPAGPALHPNGPRLPALFLALAVLFAFAPAAVQAQVSREYQVKAVFLFNFAQFVEWPPRAFGGDQEALVIGVLGHDPFGAYLDEAVRGETVHGRPLRIERFRRAEDIRTCHVLYVSRSEAARLPQILSALRGREILAVSDVEGFAGRGGAIQFVTERNKVRLRINVDAARAAALTISSKLLRPAEIVSTGGGK